MEFINITEAKARLSEVVNRAEAGEEIIITRMGKPAARLSACLPDKQVNRIGFLEGQASVPDDFDDWPEEEARALGIID